MGTVAFANGAQVLTDTNGETVTAQVGVVAAAASFGLQAGSGMVFTANATNSVFHSGSQTASHIYVPMSEIFATYDVDTRLTYIFSVYFSTITIPTAQVGAGAGAQTGLWGLVNVPSSGTSPARTRGARRTNVGGVQIVRSNIDAGEGSTYTGETPNTLSLSVGYGSMSIGGGTWAGAWSTTSLDLEIAAPVVSSNNPSTFKDRSNRWYIAFGTGQISADMAITVQRAQLRVR